MNAPLRLLASATTAPILRDYQVEGVAAIRPAFTQWRRVLFVLPTGGGKTVCFAFITPHAAAKGNRVIVLAPPAGNRRPDQRRPDRDGRAARPHPAGPRDDRRPRAGRHGADRGTPPGGHPGARAAGDRRGHHAVAGTWAKITAAWPNAKVLGVTATPERLDGVGLRDAFDTLVLGPDVRELIDAGYLAPFRYLAPNTPSTCRACAASAAISTAAIWSGRSTRTASPATSSSTT